MPTSATGTPKRANGFTLVELMIVLAIVGIASAAVVLAFPDPQGSATSEAARLAARINAARDRAIVEARPISVIVTPTGYAFEQYRQREWQRLGEPPLAPQALREGSQALIGSEPTLRITFDSTGIAEPAEVEIMRGGATARVTIGADGAVRVGA